MSTSLSLLIEAALSSEDRRKTIRALFQTVQTTLDDYIKSPGAEGSPEHSERSADWTPALEICHSLEIAPSRLNRYIKELTGLTLNQHYFKRKIVLDRVDERMQLKLVKFIRDKHLPGKKTYKKVILQEFCREVHQELKIHRQETGFDKNDWAIEHGFPNYATFHKAFVLAWRMTPLQFEAKIIREAAHYYRAAHALRERRDSAASDKPLPFDTANPDHFVQKISTDLPGWKINHTRYGLAEDLEPFVNNYLSAPAAA